MTIYIDADFKCYAEPGEGRTAYETDFFEGKSREYLEGYRFVPAGQIWRRTDGAVFAGELICPWKDWQELDRAQGAYERQAYPELRRQNQELLETMARMVEEVYESDLNEMEGDTECIKA